ncbi:MAG: glycosyltransferase family 25 protein [Alphaproteobacteria bacterium]
MAADLPRTFVISLPEATERQAYIREHLGALGLPFEFFEAVDGRGFDVPNHPAYDATRRRRWFGRDLKPGELGCFLSHRGIYEKMVRDDIPMAFIVEDDVILQDTTFALLADLQRVKTSFDIVRFLGTPKHHTARQKILEELPTKPYTLNRLYGMPGGAYAYVITQGGARKMLSAMDRTAFPIDTLMGREWVHGARGLIVMPSPAYADMKTASYIGEARFDKDELDVTGLAHAFYPLTRAVYKMREGIMKAWTYWLRLNR